MPALAAIPGVRDLWARTLGSPDVAVALIDGGPFDVSHPCFEGADLTVVDPFWLADDGTTELLREHGTVAASLLFGRHGSSVAGMAPACRGVLVPALGDVSFARDPLGLVRALDVCVDAGADVICLGVCAPVDTAHVDDALARALRRAAEQRALVVAPAGNDGGRSLCLPAVHPDALAVGAHDDDGNVCAFSNHGPAYRDHGIVAPGTNVTGAAPGGGTVTRRGTSVATPIAGGVVALLLSLLRERDRDADPLDVGDALVASAAPCTAAASRGEPERCLAGRLDVPAATRRVLDPGSAKPPWHPQATGASLAAHAPPMLAYTDGGGATSVAELGRAT